MMHKWLLTFAMFYSSNTLATIDLNQMQRLFDSGNSQEAYDYARSELLTYEGDPFFDYYYGTAAIDVGHASEGVYALERVLVSQPNNYAARLELARGYFILQEYDRSRAEFNTALKFKPPAGVREKINAYLDAIRLQESRYKTTSTAYIELGYGADSNVNSGPSNPSVVFLGITGQLDPTALEQRDHYKTLKANYGISTPLTAGILFNASINANLRNNSEHSEVDTETYTVTSSFRFLHAQNSYSIGIVAQQFSVNSKDYRQLAGINADWSRHLSQQSTLQTFLQFSQQDFDGQETRNIDNSTFGLGLTKRFDAALSPVLFTSIFAAQDTPESSSTIAKQIAERDYYGARIGVVFTTSPKTSTRFSVNYQNSEYGLEDINGILREDDYSSSELNFTWLLSRNWSLLADASYIQNDSNNTINIYDRKQASVSFRYEVK